MKLTLLILISLGVDICLSLNEQDTIERLLSKYDSSVGLRNLTVSVSLTLNQLVGINEKEKIMVTSSMFEISWTDQRLRFDVTEDGIEKVLLRAESVWIPDFYVINIARTHGFLRVYKESLVNVDFTGQVTLFIDVGEFNTKCQLDYYKFPYDIQTCDIIIGSWQHNSKYIYFDVTEARLTVKKSTTNNVWSIESTEVQDSVVTERFAYNQSGQDVYFRLHLSRRPMNYMLNKIFPTFVLSAVTLLSFFFYFAQQCLASMNIFLALAIYSVNFSSEFPTQAEYVPLISVYLMLGILYTFCILVWFILKEVIAQRREELPGWMTTVALSIRPHVRAKPIKRTSKVSLKKDGETEKEVTAVELEAMAKRNEERSRKEKTENLWTLNMLVFWIFLFIYIVSYCAIWTRIIS